jgi:broad-specificity NMP kinase
MSLFLVTGTSGTGKSDVCRVLKERGYEAYDTDDDGLARWQHNETGYIHPKSSVKAEQRTAAFIAEHSWNVPRDYLEDLLRSSGNRPVFICGSPGNEDKIRGLFKVVFVLCVDDGTLMHRLATRTSNDWGKQPHELEQTLQHHHEIYDKHRKLGDIVIDATRPVGDVVDSIVQGTEV